MRGVIIPDSELLWPEDEKDKEEEVVGNKEGEDRKREGRGREEKGGEGKRRGGQGESILARVVRCNFTNPFES